MVFPLTSPGDSRGDTRNRAASIVGSGPSPPAPVPRACREPDLPAAGHGAATSVLVHACSLMHHCSMGAPRPGLELYQPRLPVHGPHQSCIPSPNLPGDDVTPGFPVALACLGTLNILNTSNAEVPLRPHCFPLERSVLNPRGRTHPFSSAQESPPRCPPSCLPAISPDS